MIRSYLPFIKDILRSWVFFAFLVTDLSLFIVSNDLPLGSTPKPFSIEQLAKSYRDKISKLTFDSNLPESPSKNNFDHKMSPNNIHWANREFYEYFDVV